MPERDHRLPCPVCRATLMDRLAVGPAGGLEIDHCRRCSGVWLEHGEVQRLRALPAAALWKQVVRRSYVTPMRCHDCHGALGRGEAACPTCGRPNVLDCPGCARPMGVEEHAGLRLDVCHGCRGVWFDHAELESIWSASLGDAERERRTAGGTALGAVGEGAAHTLGEALFYAPDLVFHGARAAVHGVGASAEALSQLPGAVASAPGAASAVFQVVGHAAEVVFEGIVAIVCGIFEGF